MSVYTLLPETRTPFYLTQGYSSTEEKKKPYNCNPNIKQSSIQPPPPIPQSQRVTLKVWPLDKAFTKFVCVPVSANE